MRPRTAEVGDTVEAAALARLTGDALRRAGTARIAVTTGSRSFAGEVDVRGAPPAYRIAGGSGSDAVEVRYVQGVLYLGGPEFSALAGGRRFLRVDPDAPDMMSRLLRPLLTTLRQAADPSALMAAFGRLEAKVVRVDGDRATYSMRVGAAQLEKATEQLLGEPLPAQAVQRLRPVTFEQTVDRDGRILSATQSGGADGSSSVRYSGYGSALEVTAPAAADVGTAAG